MNMEDDAKSNGIIYWFLGAIGLGAVATAVTVPKFGLWLALVIILLALLIFGLYFLYRRLKSRRQSRGPLRPKRPHRRGPSVIRTGERPSTSCVRNFSLACRNTRAGARISINYLGMLSLGSLALVNPRQSAIPALIFHPVCKTSSKVLAAPLIWIGGLPIAASS